MKTLHQMLKEKEVEKWINNSETITTDRVCSFWKKKIRFNEHMYISSPKKFIANWRKICLKVTTFSGIRGRRGVLAAKLKSWGTTGKEGRGIQSESNIFASSSAWLWAELHPLLCTDMNPQSVTVVVFELNHGSGLPWGLGSACSHEMGFQFINIIIIIIYNKIKFIF